MPDPSGDRTLIEARRVTKVFPGTVALHDVDLTVRPGEVVAVVGANGSGKTTLLSVLCGLLRPTRGGVAVDGEAVALGSPADALARGIAYVPQEPQLAPALTAWENLLLADYARLGGRRPSAVARRKARDLAAEALAGRSPDTPVAELRKAERATLCLAAGLRHQPRVLALDEPTAVLGDRGVEVVEAATRSVVRDGGAVLLVSHRLRDIVRLATHVVVLVDGHKMHDGPIDTSTVASLIDSLSAGRDVREAPTIRVPTTARPAGPPPNIPPVISLTDVGTPTGLRIRGLEVRRGELVGIAGLAGSGRSRLCRVVAGNARYSGSIEFAGGPHRPEARAMRRIGIGYLPEDRKREGVFTGLSVERNLEVADLVAARGVARPWRWRPDRRKWAGLADRFGVKRAAESAPVTSLSGGNQQRLVLARTLAPRPRLLVVDEPTQGVDRSGRGAIHEMIREFADSGGAALIVSSEFEELQELCDRLVVMLDGSPVAEVGADVPYRDLMSYATIGSLHTGEAV